MRKNGLERARSRGSVKAARIHQFGPPEVVAISAFVDSFRMAGDPGTGGGVASCSGVAPRLRTAWLEPVIDACGLATLTPQEETESPGEFRSQRRLCLPSVDE